MRTTFRFAVLFALLPTVSACADKLTPADDGADQDASVEERDDDDAVDSDIPKRSGKFRNSPKRDGSVVTIADASVEEEWQQFDFDTGKSADGERDWDLAFSRFRIRTNGGVSGPGGVYVAELVARAFDDVTQAPEEGFAADREDTDEDTDSDPDNAFNSGDADWYSYNVMTHELSPKDITYVIASSEARFYKFRIEEYYDDAGTPAIMQFRWAEIEAPASGWPPFSTSAE